MGVRAALVLGAWLAGTGVGHARGPARFAQASQRVADGVVAVESEGGGKRRHGGGFVASPDGLVVCSSQTVENAEHVRVHLGTGWVQARVVATDATVRVALLKVEVGTPLKVVPVAARARMAPEHWMLAVERRPDGSTRATAGMLAQGQERHVEAGSAPGGRPSLALVDLSAMAGAPLVNLNGEVVGMSMGRLGARRSRATDVEPLREFLAEAARQFRTAQAGP